MNAPQIVKDRLAALGVRPSWLANHPRNPVGRVATYNVLRGECRCSIDTFTAWLEILHLGIVPVGRRPSIPKAERIGSTQGAPNGA